MILSVSAHISVKQRLLTSVWMYLNVDKCAHVPVSAWPLARLGVWETQRWLSTSPQSANISFQGKLIAFASAERVCIQHNVKPEVHLSWCSHAIAEVLCRTETHKIPLERQHRGGTCGHTQEQLRGEGEHKQKQITNSPKGLESFINVVETSSLGQGSTTKAWSRTWTHTVDTANQQTHTHKHKQLGFYCTLNQ